ncbi:hypothetical protein GZH46_00078 [Fragariocoptes setiger]|uniref:Uncharacterized protein n=1 Tax=Fragariocoptes setiger TaxID=1670756 RepID=A0ABQ7SD62_9ACAR|nr:hypothetical protein GZH46_00078 [Fragariocoptes setiger]
MASSQVFRLCSFMLALAQLTNASYIVYYGNDNNNLINSKQLNHGAKSFNSDSNINTQLSSDASVNSVDESLGVDKQSIVSINHVNRYNKDITNQATKTVENDHQTQQQSDRQAPIVSSPVVDEIFKSPLSTSATNATQQQSASGNGARDTKHTRLTHNTRYLISPASTIHRYIELRNSSSSRAPNDRPPMIEARKTLTVPLASAMATIFGHKTRLRRRRRPAHLRSKRPKARSSKVIVILGPSASLSSASSQAISSLRSSLQYAPSVTTNSNNNNNNQPQQLQPQHTFGHNWRQHYQRALSHTKSASPARLASAIAGHSVRNLSQVSDKLTQQRHQVQAQAQNHNQAIGHQHASGKTSLPHVQQQQQPQQTGAVNNNNLSTEQRRGTDSDMVGAASKEHNRQHQAVKKESQHSPNSNSNNNSVAGLVVVAAAAAPVATISGVAGKVAATNESSDIDTTGSSNFKALQSAMNNASAGNNKTSSKPIQVRRRRKQIRTLLPVGLTSWLLGGIRDLDGRHWHMPAEVVDRLVINDVDFHPAIVDSLPSSTMFNGSILSSSDSSSSTGSTSKSITKPRGEQEIATASDTAKVNSSKARLCKNSEKRQKPRKTSPFHGSVSRYPRSAAGGLWLRLCVT